MADDGARTFRTPAAAYDRHVGRYGGELARALTALAEVRPGHRALDVGCGTGMSTAGLAAVVGAHRVAAVDPSEPFVEACRRRVPGAGVGRGSAEALPFRAGSFDRALAQLVVNFMADPGRGVAEMRRVTRPGGVVAAAVWDYAGGMTLLRAFWDAAVEVDEAAARLDEGVSMPHCDPGSLARLWEGAGLTGVEAAALDTSVAYADFDELWAPLLTGVAPSGAFTVALDARGREALRDALYRRLGSPPGGFALGARAWAVVGTA